MTELPYAKALQGAVPTEPVSFPLGLDRGGIGWPPARPERDGPGAPWRTITRVFRALSAWRSRERAVAELARLDDAMLADLGLHRSEIRSAVRDADETGTFGERRRRR